MLNVYARTSNAFRAVDRQLLGLLAGQAAITVTVTLSDHLRIALSSRSAIDQATGIVMAQQRGTPEQAFAALRTISQRRNIKLRPNLHLIPSRGPERSLGWRLPRSFGGG